MSPIVLILLLFLQATRVISSIIPSTPVFPPIRRDVLVGSPLQPRAEQQNSTTVPASWDEVVASSCKQALAELRGLPASHSGMSMCFNIRSLSNTTGVFRADLRLYTVSSPRRNWAGINMKDVNASVAFVGASATNVPLSQLDIDTSSNGVATRRRLGRRATGNETKGVRMAQQYAFVGQLNAFDEASVNITMLQKWLTPVVSLVYQPSSGNGSILTLSPHEASFLSGPLSSVPHTLSRLSPSARQTLFSSGVADAEDIPFIVPGMRIEIPPIGAIVTGSWAFLFTLTVGWGTYGRYQFREAHRRKVRSVGTAMGVGMGIGMGWGVGGGGMRTL